MSIPRAQRAGWVGGERDASVTPTLSRARLACACTSTVRVSSCRTPPPMSGVQVEIGCGCHCHRQREQRLRKRAVEPCHAMSGRLAMNIKRTTATTKSHTSRLFRRHRHRQRGHGLQYKLSTSPLNERQAGNRRRRVVNTKLSTVAMKGHTSSFCRRPRHQPREHRLRQ